MIDPGDEVIVPAPYWTTYPEAIQLAGGVPVPVLADETQGYKVTVEQLEAARTDTTKVLLFVSPSNPTGAVYTADEIRAIGRWVEDNDLWALTDEIYEHLVYDGVETGSLPVLCPYLADNCVVVNGVAKTYAMTGWRVGWMIGPKDLVAAVGQPPVARDVQRRQRLPAGGPGRGPGDLSAVDDDEGGLRPPPQDDRVDAQRDRRASYCPMPEGAFYAYPSVKGLLGREYDGRVDRDLGRAGRVHPRRGRGGRRARARRSARRLPAAVLRARRRRPGRGHHPAAEAVRLRDLSGSR